MPCPCHLRKKCMKEDGVDKLSKDPELGTILILIPVPDNRCGDVFPPLDCTFQSVAMPINMQVECLKCSQLCGGG
jgi:hypothetical protein